MKVERETAGFALPFTAGVFLAAFSGLGISDYHIFSLIASLGLVVFCLFTLLHPVRKSFDAITLWMLTATAALSAGMICGFTAERLSLSTLESAFSIRAREYGSAMQRSIDSLPFSNSDCNALAKALLTGDRSDVPGTVLTAFRDSGASHILALSGLHLGIIYGIITFVTSIIGNSRRAKCIRALISISVCGFYTLSTGAGPSIVRAFLFILLAEISRLTFRRTGTAQFLYASLIIQLAISPLSIRSAGFQLSYAAMAGIAFILPKLQGIWPGSIYRDRRPIRWVRKVWNTAALSISCQMTTAPLAYLHFGTFPSNFLICNLIALPLTGIIIPASIITLLLHSLGICPDFAIHITERLISALIYSLEIIAVM